MTPTAPIDRTHRDSVEAVASIRRLTNEARQRLGLPVKSYEANTINNQGE